MLNILTIKVSSIIIGLLFVSISSFFIIPYTASAYESGDYTYTVSGGLATIKRYNGTETDLTIPAMLDGYPVDAIHYSAFGDCDTLRTVIIPDGVTTIRDYAFSGCSSLEWIFIPSSVTSIGYFVFLGSNTLLSIDVDPNSTSYTDIDGVLFDVGVTILISFPGGRAGSYVLPETCIAVDDYSFYECRSIVSVEMNEGLEYIGSYAFSYCTNLTDISIPSTVETIAGGAFSMTSNLTNIDVDEDNQYYYSSDGVLFNKEGTALIICPEGKTGEFVVPSGVTLLSDSAFYHCYKLLNVNLPEGLRYIGNWTFLYCENLTTLNIPEGVLSIGSSAFSGCELLTSINIPGSVTSIGGEALDYCDSLSSITVENDNTYYASVDGVLFNKGETQLIRCPAGKVGTILIPSNTTSINYNAFWKCTSLTSINVEEDNAQYASIDGILYNKEMTNLLKCPAGREFEVVIPDDVVIISDVAFELCSKVSSVTIPSSVTSIGSWTFRECAELTSLNFLGEAMPTVGDEWILATNSSLLGHAYEDSDFPAPGEEFNGLTMGAYLEKEKSESEDNGDILIMVVIAAMVVIIMVGLVIVMRKKKK